MPNTHAPERVFRSQLGALLRQLREDSGLTLEETSQRAGMDKSVISRLETGLRGVKETTLQRLLECYPALDAAIEARIGELLQADRAHRRRPAWLRRHHAVTSTTQYDGYLALEAIATSLRNYEPSLVPGLLQTADYARAVIAGMRPDLGPAQSRQLVEVRLARQHRVLESATSLSALIEESALLRPVGDRPVMRAQLEHLIASAERPNVSVRLAPLSRGPHPGLYGPYMIMALPGATGEIVCLEAASRSVYLEEGADVDRYTESFSSLWQQALTPEDTRARLHHMVKELPQ